MADEMLFTMAGPVATLAQMVSLEEAGLSNREQLQQWLTANPEILGPGVEIITFDLEGPWGGAGSAQDRLSVLGLDQDARLVVAELKWGRTSDTDIGAIKVAAQASRMLPESLAEYYARFHSQDQYELTTEDALAELQTHAPDLSQETLRRPRIVLLARNFSPVLSSSVVFLSEIGVDLRLVQVSAFRSGSGGLSAPGGAPIISVKQVYPLREVEDFIAVSPERQLVRDAERSKRRVQDASTVRRLVGSDSVLDGTVFTLSPRGDIGPDLRARLEDWLHEEPVRRTAQWQNRTAAPLVWNADKAAYTPAALVRHIVEQATGVSRDFHGTQWWRDPSGWTMVELVGPLSGGKGGLYREFWSRWLERIRLDHGHWTQMRTSPPQNFVTMPSPVQGTHFGLLFTAGGRLRSEFFIEIVPPETSTGLFEGLQANGERVEALYGKELFWEQLPDRAAYRICDYAEGEVTDVENHDLYIDWMIASQEKLRRAIGTVLGGRPPRDEADDDEEFERR
jgi:hypothetical protein